MDFLKSFPQTPKKQFWLSTIILLLCCWFVALCVGHYLRQRPLWLDERGVFKSVEGFRVQDFFTEKLTGGQIFPRVYLFLIQKISQAFNFALLSLRFLSFVSMLAAFLIWLRLAGYELKNRREYLTFVLCWVASVPLVYYSAELKQYSMDVLAAAVFLWFLEKQTELASGNNRRYMILLMALPLLGLFSYPAFLFFIFPLYNLFVTQSGNRRNYFPAVGYGAVVLAVTCFVYLFDIRIAGATADSQGFSDYAISFQSVGEFFKTFGEGTMNLFSRWFAEQPRILKKIGVFFAVFGMLYIPYAFVKNFRWGKPLKNLDVLAFVLYAELFLLGVLKKYPFTVPRTSLFFCPVAFVMAIKGIAEVKRWNRSAGLLVQILFLIFLTIIALGVTRSVMFDDHLGAIHRIW